MRRLLLLLVPVALVLGIYWGGHPDRLPGFARKTLVADTDGRLYQEAVDEIHRDYYKPVKPDQLLDTLQEIVRLNMQEEINRFVEALDADAIWPDDF